MRLGLQFVRKLLPVLLLLKVVVDSVGGFLEVGVEPLVGRPPSVVSAEVVGPSPFLFSLLGLWDLVHFLFFVTL